MLNKLVGGGKKSGCSFVVFDAQLVNEFDAWQNSILQLKYIKNTHHHLRSNISSQQVQSGPQEILLGYIAPIQMS